MYIIKLNAIDSTNSYIKKLAFENTIDNYTVVVANHQTAGRGQMDTVWLTEQGKNLTFSILIRFDGLKIEHQFYVSMAVSLGIITALKATVKNTLFVKWPNDILADKDKIAGTLIENVISGNFIKHSVIGIGLNVNQEKFPKIIGNSTSLKNLAGTNFDKDKLLRQILTSIQSFVNLVEKKKFKELKDLYLAALYKFNIPTMFEDKSGTIFLAKIVDVCEDGKLIVALENETTRKFNLKEIKFASR